MPEQPVISIRPVDDFAGLADVWRDLEARSDGSFFQSWAWTGCLAEERFADPWLLTARRGDRVIGLGLLNKSQKQRFWNNKSFLLGESGDPSLDSIFIEDNGLLLDRDEPRELESVFWSSLAAFQQGGLHKADWILSGVPSTLPISLPPGRGAQILAMRPAPYVDFARLSRPDGLMIDNLSANARQQLRRSLRGWSEIGPLQIEIAETEERALALLASLQSFHQSYWTARGKPGAFSKPFFERFHRALIGRAGGDQQIDLIRVAAGDRVLGYLYNFVHRGRVAAYQSGFDFGPDADRLRPGLVSHLLAIEHYRGAQMSVYDFLGGEARYKRSFANAERELLWLKASRRRPAAMA